MPSCAGRCGGEHIDGAQTAATLEAAISQTRDGVGNGDGGQTAAIIEAAIAQTRDGVGNGDGGQTAATRVFTTDYYSIFYR